VRDLIENQNTRKKSKKIKKIKQTERKTTTIGLPTNRIIKFIVNWMKFFIQFIQKIISDPGHQ
jgi:hypothetical protein